MISNILNNRRFLTAAIVPVSAMIAQTHVQGAVYTWTGASYAATSPLPNNAPFGTGGNWSPNGVPGTADNIRFASTGTYPTNAIGGITTPGEYGAVDFDQSPTFKIGTNTNSFKLNGVGGVALSRTAGSTGVQTINNGIVLNTSSLTFDINGTDGRVVLLGALTNGASASSLTKTGDGTVQAANSSTFSGSLAILNGTFETVRIRVEEGKSGLGLGTSHVVLGGSSTAGSLVYTGTSSSNAAEYYRGFDIGAGGGSFINNSSNPTVTLKRDPLDLAPAANAGNIIGAGTFTLGGTGPSTVVESAITTTGGLVKAGAGAATLTSATNSYAGATTVQEGSLFINGTHNGADNYTVNNGATLAGKGVVSFATPAKGATINGIIAPGDATSPIATLTFDTGNVALNGSTNIDVDLATGLFDSIAVGNHLAYGGTLNIAFTGENAGAGAFDLFSFATFDTNNPFTFDYSGLLPSQTASFNPATGVLTVNAVPEPSSLAALGLITGALLRRRRA